MTSARMAFWVRTFAFSISLSETGVESRQLQRILWIPIISLFASSITDRATTLAGLSAGFVETNPIESWILTRSPWFFYLSSLLFPAMISLTVLVGMRILKGPNLYYHRRALSVFFAALSIMSWTPAVNNILLLRTIT